MFSGSQALSYIPRITGCVPSLLLKVNNLVTWCMFKMLKSKLHYACLKCWNQCFFSTLLKLDELLPLSRLGWSHAFAYWWDTVNLFSYYIGHINFYGILLQVSMSPPTWLNMVAGLWHILQGHLPGFFSFPVNFNLWDFMLDYNSKLFWYHNFQGKQGLPMPSMVLITYPFGWFGVWKVDHDNYQNSAHQLVHVLWTAVFCEPVQLLCCFLTLAVHSLQLSVEVHYQIRYWFCTPVLFKGYAVLSLNYLRAWDDHHFTILLMVALSSCVSYHSALHQCCIYYQLSHYLSMVTIRGSAVVSSAEAVIRVCSSAPVNWSGLEVYTFVG